MSDSSSGNMISRLLGRSLRSRSAEKPTPIVKPSEKLVDSIRNRDLPRNKPIEIEPLKFDLKRQLDRPQAEVDAPDMRVTTPSDDALNYGEAISLVGTTLGDMVNDVEQYVSKAPSLGEISYDDEKSAAILIGDHLVSRRLITADQLDIALEEQTKSGQLLGQILLDLGFLTSKQLQGEIHRLYGAKRSTGAILRSLNMRDHHIRATIEREEQTKEPLTEIMRDWGLLSQENVAKVLAIQNDLGFFPWTAIDDIAIDSLRTNQIYVKDYEGFVPIAYMKSSPRDVVSLVISDLDAMSAASSYFKNYHCDFLVASAETCQTIYRKLFARTDAQFDVLHKQYRELVDKADAAASSTCGDMFMALLRHACYTGSSDIAIHMSHRVGMLRLKVDGIWDLFRTVDRDLLETFVGVMKNTMIQGLNEDRVKDGFTDCALDLIADKSEDTKRLRQAYSDIVDRYVFRVEIGNSVQGVTVTIRINDKQSAAAELNQLGFDSNTLARIQAYTRAKNGLLLFCGPTGSGKTTSIYAVLREIDPLTTSIQTIELPVEYTHGLWQQYPISRLKRNEGEQWGEALRGILRNAPDVVLFGETRDEATAKELFRAANTGHLVLSSLHTNGAAETIARLEDLGITKEKMATMLLGILAQRLVRKLCRDCKIPDDRQATNELLTPHLDGSLKDVRGMKLFRASAKGCVNCGFTGYRGRRMVFELLHFGKSLRDRLERGAGVSEVREHGVGESMYLNGLRLVAEGVTSIDELSTHIDLEV